MNFKIYQSYLILTLFLLTGCTNDRAVDVTGIEVEVDLHRFEREVFSVGDTILPPYIEELRTEFGGFIEVFANNIMTMRVDNDTAFASNLNYFVNDTSVREVYNRVNEKYEDLDWLETDLHDFLKYYKYYFPDKEAPFITTYVSAFNYGVITSDTILGIGLDMFLGKDFIYYSQIGIPAYLYSRFTPEFIVPNCIRAIAQNDYDPLLVKNELLSQMVYEGKLIYFIKQMAPGLHDSLVTGFTGDQLEWCYESESEIWGFLIEQKLLFNTDPSTYVKYVNDGPTTSGFPDRSPGKVASFTGWKIVDEYMDKNPNVSLKQLMELNDAQSILESSGYKPNK